LKNIKIELDLPPSIALMITVAIRSGVYGLHDLNKVITKNGQETMMKIAQSIADQVAEKTDFTKIDRKRVLKDVSDLDGFDVFADTFNLTDKK